MRKRKCEVCGKLYTPTCDHQRYCSQTCYTEGQRILARRRYWKPKFLDEYHVYKSWDPKDKECRDVYFLIKTFERIDWRNLC